MHKAISKAYYMIISFERNDYYLIFLIIYNDAHIYQPYN